MATELPYGAPFPNDTIGAAAAGVAAASAGALADGSVPVNPIGLLFLGSNTFATISTGAGGGFAAAASVDAGTVPKKLAVGAPFAHDAIGVVAAGCAIVATDSAGALAGGSVLVDPIRAEKRSTALAAIVAGVVAHEPVGLPQALAVLPGAPVLEEEPAAIAFCAVLAVLASAVFATMAGGDG